MYEYIIVPCLFGAMLSTTICRLLIFWQKERTGRVFCFALVFATLCFLYLVSALRLAIPLRDTARAVLFLALVCGGFFEWRELIVYLRKKAEILQPKEI